MWPARFRWTRLLKRTANSTSITLANWRCDRSDVAILIRIDAIPLRLAHTLPAIGLLRRMFIFMEAATTVIETNAMHAVLAASVRSPDIPEAMDLYGFLIGSWELDLVGYDDDNHVIRTVGEANFAWVLEGRAVQDVFINPRRSDRDSGLPKFANWFGTTIRIYDRATQAWG